MVHDNKVTKNYGVNQFQSKRYPDEDATNPFEGQGGGTFWDFYGTSFQGQGGGTFWDFYGTFWDFYIQPFPEPRRLGIFELLRPTLFRAKWVEHFGHSELFDANFFTAEK